MQIKFKIIYAYEWSNDYLCPHCETKFNISDDSNWHWNKPSKCPECGGVEDAN